MQTEIILPGRPITKKNSQQIIINRITKKPVVNPDGSRIMGVDRENPRVEIFIEEEEDREE